ncbi:MAG: hypothetical protein WDN75_19635 [Bacteroidota bacterium]
MLARVHFGKLYVNAGPSLLTIFTEPKIWRTIQATCHSMGLLSHLSIGMQGFNWGAGYRFKIRKKLVALDVRYSHGLTDIFHGPGNVQPLH